MAKAKLGWVLVLLMPALAGCAFLRDIAASAREVAAETGDQIVDQVGDAVTGDPTAIVGAIVAVVGAIGAIVVRTILKRRAAKKGD